MSPPRVSIGLPVYNGERFVGDAIRSLAEQTYTDFELIISDNASTDETQAVCEGWANRDPRIRYSRLEENVGAAGNFNRLVDLAQGEYFKWAAADDMLEETMLARCVEILDGHPEVVLCYPKTRIVDESGAFMKDYEDGFHFMAPEPARRFQQFFQAPSLCNAVFGLLRLDVLRKTARIGGYASSDRVLLGELALHGRFYEVPDRLFLRRIHPEKSTIANPTDHLFGIWFDPARRGKVSFPRWRRFREYTRAVTRAPLPPAEKRRAYLVLARFALIPGRWTGLFGDLFAGILQFLGRSRQKPPETPREPQQVK